MILKTRHSILKRLMVMLSIATVVLSSTVAIAGPREQARRIHDRIAGVPASAATLDQMEALVASGDALGAADVAMQSPGFYSVTLKNFATPWTNRDQDVFAPLNDYTATVIGVVRDDLPFTSILWDDIAYVGAANLGLPAFSNSNNAHYEALENQNIDLGASLERRTQSSLNGLPPTATAGIMTSRAAAEAFFVLGTNRAMLRFTLLNHMCNDLEQLQDSTRPPDRIRKDVTRSPGGDSRLFLNNCVACHSGMDPLAQAFAYYNFDETSAQMEYTSGQVQPKYHINENNFPFGFLTPDDRWDNYWRKGRNSLLGWDQSLPGTGNGAKSLGRELAGSDAFAQCQVEKTFENVCLRPPTDAADRTQVSNMVTSFKSGGYRLKQVFAESSVYCMGD